LFDVELAWGEAIHFKNPKFNVDHFDNQGLSPEGNNPGTVFVGMVHSGSSSMYAILEESACEDDSTSSDGGSFGFLVS
jgi:hypothetical protein